MLIGWWLQNGCICENFAGSTCFPFSLPEVRFWKRNEYEKSRGCHTLQGVITTLVLSIDIENGPEWNIHHAALWSYLVFLAKAGKIVGIVGGPPCRSTSRLRHRSPGPRPLRGRDGLRWGLDNLTAPEQTKTDGDSMLVLKQLALWQMAEDARVTEKKTLFAMESPEDPMSYMPDQAQSLPSFWNWREVQDMASRHEWVSTSFDQGRLGHEKRKPTTTRRVIQVIV